MKRLFKTLAFALLMTGVSFAQDVSGDWNGTLHVNGGELRLMLHITKNTDGSLKATIDSIDQGTNGIPVTSVTLKDSKLNLKIDAINGSYDGVVKGNGSEIDGTWSQGQSFELNFHRPSTSSDQFRISFRRQNVTLNNRSRSLCPHNSRQPSTLSEQFARGELATSWEDTRLDALTLSSSPPWVT